jgi:alpha-D-ribose 1-methylphosphonate 5-triphosphate synthase subunit PhnH
MSTLAAGFGHAVFDSQRAFTAAMRALSRPGVIERCGEGLPPDAPLPAAGGAALLALCDQETPLFLSPSVAATPDVATYLRFHTGARIVGEPALAAFALVDMRADGLALNDFAQGTPEYPDRSATVIAMCGSLRAGPSLPIAGPGIKTVAALTVTDLPSGFAEAWARSRAAFPLGVDILFAAGTEIVGLPRSARILTESA